MSILDALLWDIEDEPGPCAPKELKMMDKELVAQAFAAQVYTAALDVVQQAQPLPLTGLPLHKKRAAAIVADVADWMGTITAEELANMARHNEYLPFDRWMPEREGYDDVAVCDTVQAVILTAARAVAPLHIDLFDMVHGASAYLADMNPHKAGWLAERAANLLAVNLQGEG